MAAKRIIQYVAIRKDLSSSLGWPGGAVIAQACHACTAVISLYRDDHCTQEYLKELDSMHKVIVEVASEEALTKLSEKLKMNNINYKLWIEQPENFPTCLATKPYPKDEVSKFFKGLQLYK